jgi:hypothetical protein
VGGRDCTDFGAGARVVANVQPRCLELESMTRAVDAAGEQRVR